MTKFNLIFIISSNKSFIQNVKDRLQTLGYDSSALKDIDELIAEPYLIKAIEETDDSLVIFDNGSYFADSLYFDEFQKEEWHSKWLLASKDISTAQLCHLCVGPETNRMKMGTHVYKNGFLTATHYGSHHARSYHLGIKLMETLRLHGGIVESRWYWDYKEGFAGVDA